MIKNIKSSLLKFPIIEAIIAILWLYPFKTSINDSLFWVSFSIGANLYLGISHLSDWITHKNTPNGDPFGFMALFLAFPILFIIKIIILTFVILLIINIKRKYKQKY